MKRRSRRHANLMREACGGFVRGFTAAALVAAVQHRQREDIDKRMRRVLRIGLLGGGSMATGAAVVDALEQRRWGTALAAVAVGAGGMLAVEHLLNDDTNKEQSDGQETQEE